jgi:hypothetical protein
MEGSSSSNGKIRFDLKQISTWDRQNEQELKKKQDGKQAPQGKRSAWFDRQKTTEEGGDGTGFDHGYRDRALERRKEINTEEAQLEEMVSKLDAEKTKFLGGKLTYPPTTFG